MLCGKNEQHANECHDNYHDIGLNLDPQKSAEHQHIENYSKNEDHAIGIDLVPEIAKYAEMYHDVHRNVENGAE